MLSPDLVESCRRQFPGLAREVAGQPAVFLDGPGGTQVPQRVIDAVSHCLAHTNANHGGQFATSHESDEMLEEAHRAVADLLGARDPHSVCFGANMTTLTFALSRALARTWRPRDEVLVTRLDHDANVTPWVLAARDAGATVRYVNFRPEDGTLDFDDLRRKLSDRTRLVAFGCASNALGTINPVRLIIKAARDAGALTFLDAVHFAPHMSIDVESWGCDFLACSAYKFFGPHVGVLWGRRELLEGFPAYRVRPAPEDLPGKWMTGTQNHEGIAGTAEAVRYLADLGQRKNPMVENRREALEVALVGIGFYEQVLSRQMLAGLRELPQFRVHGITDPARVGWRLPTFALTHARWTAAEMARRLGELGFFAWHGNYYALQVTEALGLEPHGMLRIGLVHYNTPEEVDRLLHCLRREF